MRYLALVLVAAAGCLAACTQQQRERPTPSDVVAAKDEVGVLGDRAKMTHAFVLTAEQIAEIEDEVAKTKHAIDRLAEAAGVATTVAAEDSGK